MKRIGIILMFLTMTLGVFAQNRAGSSSAGFTMGYGFDTENLTIGLDYRYSFTNELRIAPSLTHFVKNNGVSAWKIDGDVHYLFPLSSQFSFYPLGGVSLSFWKGKWGRLSDSVTRFGLNVGLGGELYATKEITVGLEFKYNFVKDLDQALVGVRVGYNF